MSLLIRCDTCGAVIPKPGKLPTGWQLSAKYVTRGVIKRFKGMRHSCPSCPHDVTRAGDETLPVITAQQGLLEVEEAARFAVLDEDDLRGSSRKVMERALAILDAARERLGE